MVKASTTKKKDKKCPKKGYYTSNITRNKLINTQIKKHKAEQNPTEIKKKTKPPNLQSKNTKLEIGRSIKKPNSKKLDKIKQGFKKAEPPTLRSNKKQTWKF